MCLTRLIDHIDHGSLFIEAAEQGRFWNDNSFFPDGEGQIDGGKHAWLEEALFIADAGLDQGCA